MEKVSFVTESALVWQRAMPHHVLFEHFISSGRKVACVI